MSRRLTPPCYMANAGLLLKGVTLQPVGCLRFRTRHVLQCRPTATWSLFTVLVTQMEAPIGAEVDNYNTRTGFPFRSLHDELNVWVKTNTTIILTLHFVKSLMNRVYSNISRTWFPKDEVGEYITSALWVAGGFTRSRGP